ncbi:VOC family protein [Brachybacterium sp. YJGR34]|uniref:VOC family protein n=1 Tax=Brachybacterium sp. YJGR34 TaxID=2059911 RepID=UPI000E0C1135|nr:VOC family protein [Brachybacterium sp. YJGR34]
MTSPGSAGRDASGARPAPRPALHHLELWTADLAATEDSWHWLLTSLGWTPRPVEGWVQGRLWVAPDGSYLVLEQSDDIRPGPGDRRAPGMNHLALTVADRAALDALRAGAPAHGWRELFAERYPHAGGADHVAWYGEDPEGIEVELVAVR